MYKRIISLILIIGTLSTFASAAALDEAAASGAASIQALSDEYNLKDISVDQIPDGIVPIEFETVEEAENFLELVAKNDSPDIEVVPPVEYDGSNQQLSLAAVHTAVQTKKIPNTNIYLLEGEGYLTYTWDQNGSYKKFVEVTDFDAGYVGMTAFVGYNLRSWAPNFNAIKTSVTITFTGTTEYYLVIKGIGKFYERSDTSDVTFYAEDT